MVGWISLSFSYFSYLYNGNINIMESLRQPAWRSKELRWRKIWGRQYHLSPWIKPYLQLINLRFFFLTVASKFFIPYPNWS